MRRLLAAAALMMSLSGFAPVNPVIEGDNPDPTVLAARGAFYASSTVSAWAPLFPIYRSDDLVTWRQVGAVLGAAPPWSAGHFWAPELVRAPRGGGYLAYYSASAVVGKPCIGVASAPRPEGPYRDRGRAICPRGGAIDAAPVTDERGRPWLGWKALGVGGGIHLQRLRADGLRTAGPSRLLIAPNRSWERGVTEGAAFVHHGGRWYLFYAGGGCCHPPCAYAEGVAVAGRLAGPYTKLPDPLETSNAAFRCPGHGTLVDLGGRGTWLVHHAYRVTDVPDARRLMVLSRVDFGPDGTPQINGGAGVLADGPLPSGPPRRAPLRDWSDAFSRPLSAAWQWLFDRVPRHVVRGGDLQLGCAARASAPALLTRQVVTDRVAAVTAVAARGGAAAALVGVDLTGDLRGVEVRNGALRAIRVRRDGRVSLGPRTPAPPGRRTRLLIGISPGGGIGLRVAAPTGWMDIAPGPAAQGPPVTRLGLACYGGGSASYGYARVVTQPEPPAAPAPAPPAG